MDELVNIGVTCNVFPSHFKGLGRSEQGSTDHIKVKVKNNNYGLGANASYEVSTFNISDLMHGNCAFLYDVMGCILTTWTTTSHFLEE